MNIRNLFNKLTICLNNKQLKQIGTYTTRYNCIAYALGFNTLNIWPIEYPPAMRNDDMTLVFWPTDLLYDESLDNFIELFKKFGYEQCPDGSYQKDYRKIAIYCKNGTDTVKHAALLVSPNLWKSKLGESYLVEHTIDALKGDSYGTVRCFMRRPLTIRKDEDLKIIESYIKQQ